MIQLRKSADRGHAQHGWLDSRHTFSFGGYFDRAQMGFGVLRVINEDRIEGGTGFDTHGHKDMEIISYVVEGALEHKDSMGSSSVIRPGDVQRMSAGSGVRHSEQNHLGDGTTHFLQIWIVPEKTDVAPSYEQKSFNAEFSAGGLVLVASRDGRNGSLHMNQDVDMYVCKTDVGGETSFKPARRRVWIQVVKGGVSVDGTALGVGDGAAYEGQKALALTWESGSEFLAFDLP